MLPQPRQTETAQSDVDQRGLTQVATIGGAAVAVLLVATWWYDPVVWLMPVTGFLVVTAAVVDWHTMRIPNRLTLAALVALVPIALMLVAQRSVSGWDLLAGVALMAGPLLGAHLFTRAHLPGLGDVKFAGLLGITLGAVSPATAYAALLGSLLLGAGFGAVYRARTGARGFPLAPAIAAATVLVLVISSISRGGE